MEVCKVSYFERTRDLGRIIRLLSREKDCRENRYLLKYYSGTVPRTDTMHGIAISQWCLFVIFESKQL